MMSKSKNLHTYLPFNLDDSFISLIIGRSYGSNGGSSKKYLITTLHKAIIVFSAFLFINIRGQK